MQKRFLIPNLLLAALCCTANAAPPLHNAQSRTVFQHALPPLDGSRLQVTSVEVTYPPGGSSLPHTHPCPVIGYVLKGAVRMQVQGGVEALYKAGDSFFEAPGGVHQVSKNASSQAPATFLAYFICDHSAALSVLLPQNSPEQ